MKETSSATQASPVRSAPSPYPDYSNPDYPVLSFMYALYCDRQFSDAANKKWRDDGGLQGDYRGYLDHYRGLRRPFPEGAETQIAVDVAATGTRTPDGKYYIPTERQATTMVTEYINKELTTRPTETFARPRVLASFNVDRPWLSALALVFVNGEDPDALSPQVPSEIRLWLARHVVEGQGDERPYLSQKGAEELTPRLVEELTNPDLPCW